MVFIYDLSNLLSSLFCLLVLPLALLVLIADSQITSLGAILTINYILIVFLSFKLMPSILFLI